MKRIIISACLLALVVCLAVPAFAAGWPSPVYPAQHQAGYLDNFLYSYNLYQFEPEPSWYLNGTHYSGEIVFTDSNSTGQSMHDFRYYPLGFSNGLVVADFTDNVLEVVLPFSMDVSTSGYLTTNITVRAFFYDDNGDAVGSGYANIGSFTYDTRIGNDYVFTGTANVPSGTTFVNFRFDFAIPANRSYTITTSFPSGKAVDVSCYQPFRDVASIVDPYDNGKVSTNGNTETVTFSTLHDNLFWNASTGAYRKGSQFMFDFVEAGSGSLCAFPLGQYGFLACDGIPENSQLNINFQSSSSVNFMSGYDVIGKLYLVVYDENYVAIPSLTKMLEATVSSTHYGSFSVDIDAVFNSNDLGGGKYFRFSYVQEYNKLPANAVVSVDSVAVKSDITLQYSSIFQLQEQGKITNEKLDEIQDAIAGPGGTNDKLDEIINGQVNPKPPQDSNKVEDLEDVETDIRDDAQAGLDGSDEIIQNAFDVVFAYASSFAAVGVVFNYFANIPFFSGLLYVAVAIGLYGFILGLTLDAVGAYDDHFKADMRDRKRKKEREARAARRASRRRKGG